MTSALSELTTLRVGGPPARLVEVRTQTDLVEVVRAVWATDEPWFLLGGGSNTVAADEGFPGTVVRVATRGIERVPGAAPGRVRLRVQAGEPWDEVVATAVAEGLAGIEALSGIPGSTGAAPVQNIGAYGQELSSVLAAVDFLDAESGEVVRLTAAELELGYRSSALKNGRRGVVLAVELDLATADDSAQDVAGRLPLGAPVAYAQLANALGVPLGARVPIVEVRRAVLALRASKGMVLDPADPDSVSAGSFFTNPIVNEHFARTLPSDAPRWPVGEPNGAPLVTSLEDVERGAELALPWLGQPASASVKLSAAWLIERAGISRGFRLPGSTAAISSKHTLAIVTSGTASASASDVAELARFVQSRVQSEFGVILQPEPVLLGVFL
ncbi:UDP-N-acetylmuramate dehydrogenase [Compostimonas suwonensis]|uniref:UDP-N-acetylenolpyruvoylglucosamine reductase n=1 Tax=Compostimonas suwonensis TaxID=1048394 RepID=A0A2M9BCW7_9MICO|nr:UDP-N-acetylmuramate dehydrogenase [Compostimonas suwonensis]PJJ55772.1 UDP-N-acetylmuramate dehydrogenase [Compostimonas suwonensis]